MGNILSGLGGLIGGIVGNQEAQPYYDTADQDQQDAIDQYRGLNPNVQAQQVGPSALGQIGSQQTRGDQLAALSALKQRYQSGGLDAQARADLANANAQQAEQIQAQRGAVANSAAQHGMSGGLASLAAQRSAAQSGANASALAGVNAVAGGQNRADAALNSYGQMAGMVRGQDYGQAANAAQANDAISQFNANQRANAAQSSYNNAYGRASGIAAQDQNQYSGQTKDADRKKASDQAIGSGIGAVGDGVLGMFTGGLG